MPEFARALRALSRQPTFALTVVATLGLALGVTTGFFGVLNALLLRPLPGVEERGLVTLHVERQGEDDPFSGFSRPTFLDLRERSGSLARLEAFVGRGFAVEDARGGGEVPGGDAPVGGQLVSGGFFELLGTRPRLGRLLDPSDDRDGAEPVAVITEALWQKRFGQAPDILGRALRVNGRAFTLVGVAETGYRGHFVGFPLDVYLPLAAAPLVATDVDLEDRKDQSLELLGRLREGVDARAAQAELHAIAAALQDEHPVDQKGQGVVLRPFSGLDHDLRGPVLGFVAVLAVVGGLVLLVAIANVAGLVLARGVARERDLAVRAALGASRADLARPMLTETLILFGAGGLLGALLMRPAAAGLHSFLPEFAIPLHLEVVLDWRVALFAAAATLASALLLGLGPVARTARVDVVDTLKRNGRGLAAGSGTARRVLVAAQAGLSLVLLFAAGLFLRELQSSRSFDPGFRTTDVGLVTVNLSLLAGPDAPARAFFAEWLDAVRAKPGVAAAALVAEPPLGLGRASTRVLVDGREPPSPDGFLAGFAAVSPGYFETLGIPLRAGRDFEATDGPGREGVAIVSRSTARRLFPEGDAVGRSLRREGRPLRVVGVAEDVAADRSGRRDGLFVYVPFAQTDGLRGSIAARGTGGPAIDEARTAARELRPDLPVLGATTLAQRADLALFPQRLAAAVATACGAFGLLLAGIGLYGLVSFFVARRRFELAVRAALGADRAALWSLAMRQGLGPVTVGLAAGGVVAIGLGPLVAAFVPNVGGADPLALAGASLVLLSVSFLAAAVPAQKAASAAPNEALRGE